MIVLVDLKAETSRICRVAQARCLLTHANLVFVVFGAVS